MRASLLRLWQRLNVKASSAAIRLVKWTGKSQEYIHPKHLIKDLDHSWFVSALRPGDVVLDVGCGNGAHTCHAATHCARAFGFDLDVQQISIGIREAARNGQTNVYWLIGSAQQRFPFPDDCFDRVLFLDVLEHLDRRDVALEEIHRVLKDDGLLLLSAPNRDTSWKRTQKAAGLPYYSDPDHRIEYTEPELREELKRRGFEVRKVSPVVLDTAWAGLIDLAGGISLRLYGRLARWKREQAWQRPVESVGFQVVCAKRETEIGSATKRTS
jgi:SAM-dependent methyltransferase